MTLRRVRGEGGAKDNSGKFRRHNGARLVAERRAEKKKVTRAPVIDYSGTNATRNAHPHPSPAGVAPLESPVIESFKRIPFFSAEGVARFRPRNPFRR